MIKHDKKQLERRLWIMRFAPWCVLITVVLFAVPHYLDANEVTAQLAGELLEAQDLPSQLESLKLQLEKEQTLSNELGRSMVPAERLHDFHTRVVGMARAAGCNVRRMTEGALNSKPWTPGDPLVRNATARPAGTSAPTGGILLEAQEIRIELTGTLSQLKKFLSEFQKTETFVHTRTFSLTQVSGKGVKMDLNLVLFNLTHAKPENNS